MNDIKKSDVPRMELESFAAQTFTVPVLEVTYHSLNRPYFIIGDKESFPMVDYISPNRRNFFKIFHITAGSGIVTVGLHKYEVGPGYIGFLHPDEIMSWQSTSKDTAGHFCMIHPRYFEQDAEHVRDIFQNFPFFKADKAVLELQAQQSAIVNGHFEKMLQEERENNDDKKQAILLYLQMVMVDALRAGRNMVATNVPEQYNYIYKFLTLLESNFQLERKGVPVKHQNASEFAEQLHVHPNYLNSMVKQQTGRTLREHIQDRILYEAKTLLLQTDWDINNIGYGLGFSGPAAFTAFFKKKENMAPSAYRKIALEKHS